MEFELIDDCPVPKQLAEEVRQIKKESGATLNSCDRSNEAEPILKKVGKHSQEQLYDGFMHHLPGYNPANPPGRSTHERRNDGIAYPGPAGEPLDYWQVGMDWSNPPAVIKAAAKHGWIVTTTYPKSPHEVQHLNFRKEPEAKTTLKPGDEGERVQQLTHMLATIKSPVNHEPYLPGPFPHYGPKVIAAVKKFQKEHHQKVDGIAGPQTQTQLAVSMRAQEHGAVHH